MTADSAKRTDSEAPEASDDYLDEQYEEEIKELVERLVRRGRPKPTRPKPAANPEPEPAAKAEPELAVEAEPEAADSKLDDETEDEASAAEPQAAEYGLRRRVRVLSVVSVVLAAAFAAASTFAFFLWRDSTAQNAKQQVAERAGLIATTLFNYDYRNLGGYPARQTSVMSSALAANAKKGRPAMLDMITKGQLVWNAKVNQVYVADVHGSTAWAIVDSDAKVTSSKLIATLTGTVTRFKLVKENGVWLLSQPPETLSQGTETDTDLQGNPLSPTATPSASATPTK